MSVPTLVLRLKLFLLHTKHIKFFNSHIADYANSQLLVKGRFIIFVFDLRMFFWYFYRELKLGDFIQ